ncbi:MAG: hypothetical protein IMZ53_12895 [Thermoplasmata archaeon]|nr:hypothetical protein [Thermoplasmata archaeon]
MKTTILVLMLLLPVCVFSQTYTDTIAQQSGWIRIEPKAFNKLDGDTVRYIYYNQFITLDEENSKLIVYVRLFDKLGAEIGTRVALINASAIFNNNKTAYLVEKKTRVLSKWNMIEVPWQ